MKILNQTDILPPGVETVVTVGNFDGVHRGHTRLLARVAGLARERGAAGVAVTFEPHTRSVVHPELSTMLLTTFAEKCALMEKLGMDYVFPVNFDEKFRMMEQDEFIEKVLVGQLRARGWVMGEGHHVGRNFGGVKKNLHFALGKYHINMFTEPPETADGAVISSTRIRKLVSEGRVAEARAMLGRPYMITAERVEGVKIATKLGFPTLNFKRPDPKKVIPPAGVYAAEIEIRDNARGLGGGDHGGGVGGGGNGGRGSDGGGVGGGRAGGGGGISPEGYEAGAKTGRIAGALYFGGCPTYEGREVHFEFHALEVVGGKNINNNAVGAAISRPLSLANCTEPAIGESTHLWLHKYIRPDTAFPTEDALKSQIAMDVNDINKYFSEEML